jgi:hypothetical protein
VSKFQYTDGTRDLMRIVKYLGYSPIDIAQVRSQMRWLEELSGDFVERAREILDNLDIIDNAISTEFGSPNYALLQADVLKYAQDGRAKGMLLRKWELVRSLGQILDLFPNLIPLEDTMEAIGIELPRCQPITATLESS